MQVDMSALSFDEIQEVMNVMSSFDNIFRDSSERERSLFLEMTIKRTLEKSAVQNPKIHQAQTYYQKPLFRPSLLPHHQFKKLPLLNHKLLLGFMANNG